MNKFFNFTNYKVTNKEKLTLTLIRKFTLYVFGVCVPECICTYVIVEIQNFKLTDGTFLSLLLTYKLSYNRNIKVYACSILSACRVKMRKTVPMENQKDKKLKFTAKIAGVMHF